MSLTTEDAKERQRAALRDIDAQIQRLEDEQARYEAERTAARNKQMRDLDELERRIATMSYRRLKEERDRLKETLEEFKRNYGESAELSAKHASVLDKIDVELTRRRAERAEEFMHRIIKANNWRTLAELKAQIESDERMKDDATLTYQLLEEIYGRAAVLAARMMERIRKASARELDRMESQLRDYAQVFEVVQALLSAIAERRAKLEADAAISSIRRIEREQKAQVERELDALEERYRRAVETINAIENETLRSEALKRAEQAKTAEQHAILSNAVLEAERQLTDKAAGLLGIRGRVALDLYDRLRRELEALQKREGQLTEQERLRLKLLMDMLPKVRSLEEARNALAQARQRIESARTTEELSEATETYIARLNAYRSAVQTLRDELIKLGVPQEELENIMRELESRLDEVLRLTIRQAEEIDRAAKAYSEFSGVVNELSSLIGEFSSAAGTLTSVLWQLGGIAVSLRAQWGQLGKVWRESKAQAADMLEAVLQFVDVSGVTRFVQVAIAAVGKVYSWYRRRRDELERQRQEQLEELTSWFESAMSSISGELASAIEAGWEKGVARIDVRAIVRKVIRARVAEQLASIVTTPLIEALRPAFLALRRARTPEELRAALQRVQQAAAVAVPRVEEQLIAAMQALAPLFEQGFANMSSALRESTGYLALIAQNTQGLTNFENAQQRYARVLAVSPRQTPRIRW